MGSDPDSCWEWTGGKSKGYGYFFVLPRRHVKAYRFCYELLVGPIPEGLTLDHLCRNHGCVRPDHLEPVTLSENVARSNRVRSNVNSGRHNRVKTQCVQGHDYTEANTGRDRNGHRYCIKCNRARSTEYKQRLREVAMMENRSA